MFFIYTCLPFVRLFFVSLLCCLCCSNFLFGINYSQKYIYPFFSFQSIQGKPETASLQATRFFLLPLKDSVEEITEAPHIVFRKMPLMGEKNKTTANLHIDTSKNSCQISCFARLWVVAAFPHWQPLQCPYFTVNVCLRLTINASRLLQKAWVLLRCEETHCSLKGHV